MTDETDPLRTRTAEVIVPVPSAPPPARDDDSRPKSRREREPLELPDGAAISFAREREQVLRRLDHTVSVNRLRLAVSIGLPVWLAALLVDVYVAEIAKEGDLQRFIAVRLAAAAVVVCVMWRLHREPEPSVRQLWFLDVLAFTTVSIAVSIDCLEYRGLESPYGPSVSLILMARGATMLAPWKQGAWLFAAPALAYPGVMLIASQVDERVAAQLHDPRAVGFLISVAFMIIVSWAMLVLGGHFAWRLRREAIETRNIGRYKLLRRLGSGGGGDVWAAFDATLKQRVALKTVAGHRPGSQVLVRLEREVRALAELTHPNTVRVFDYGVTADGLWYYAMEHLHGENLRELVTREGPLPVERFVSIARQVLRALGEAHDKGIIHRDIKPENVFVAQIGGEVDIVKLLDFGIARTSGDSNLTHTGFVAGTPAYMAPETILGHPADVRSDIYSFGATVYFALTGRLAFQDDSTLALFAAHVSRPIGSMSAVSPRPIPAVFERVVQRCMAKDPAERFASTRDVLEALASIAAERAPAPNAWHEGARR
jgi:hypothetical protein